MALPVIGTVEIDIPSGYSVACFGNVQAANLQNVVLTDENGLKLFSVSANNGGAAIPSAFRFDNGQQFFQFKVPAKSAPGRIYTLKFTNATNNAPEAVLCESATLWANGKVTGKVWILACDDRGGNGNFNNCIF